MNNPIGKVFLGGFEMAVIIAANCLFSLSCQKMNNSGQGTPDQTEDMPTFEPAFFDYGNVLQGERVSHDFRLVNHSTNTVHVLAIETSCSCTAARMGDMISNGIPSQGEILLPVSFETGIRGGHNESTVTLVLVSSHHQRYVAECVMRGEVIPDFTIKPKGVNFGLIQMGQTSTQTIIFHPEYLRDLILSDVQVTDPSFKIVNQQVVADDSMKSNVMISVAFQAPITSRKMSLSGFLRAKTSSKRFSNVEVLLSGNVIPDEEIIPSDLIFSSSTPVGESRLTVSTRNPSLVDQIAIMGKDGSSHVCVGVVELTHQDWAFRHDLLATNTAICNGKQLDVKLSVNNGSGIVETRTASVKIMSLN